MTDPDSINTEHESTGATDPGVPVADPDAVAKADEDQAAGDGGPDQPLNEDTEVPRVDR